MKRQPQQPALVGTGVDDAGEVQERVRDELAVDDDANAAFLLNDEEATGAVAGVTGIDGTEEAADDPIGREAAERGRRGRWRGRWGRHRGGSRRGGRSWIGDRCR